jgi:hypothetical protein
MNLIVFLLFIAFVFRLAGWRIPLPQAVRDVLSIRKNAGQSTLKSTLASAESAPVGDDDLDTEDWTDNSILTVQSTNNRVSVMKDPEKKPGLMERMTSRIEQWAGEPEIVLETVMPETDKETQRAHLVAHLKREFARSGLTTTAIVHAAADQDDAPWGRVSRATIWRVYAQINREDNVT